MTDDNFRLAADSDRANEDSSKLEYRAELQSSLAKLAALMELLDDRVQATAVAWSVKPQSAQASLDAIPEVPPHVIKPPAAVPDTAMVSAQADPATHVADAAPIVNDGWTVLFRAKDPLAWNFPIRAKEIYSVPMSAAPRFRFIRLRRLDTGDDVIMEASDFTEPPASSERLWFRSDKAIDRGQCELGIVDPHHVIDRKAVATMALTPKGDLGGWGFGTNQARSGQGYMWDSRRIDPTGFEIAVTARPLRPDEQKRLLAP